MNDAVLVTGATGLLGTEIVKQLVKTADRPVFVLVRAQSGEEALHRLKTVWWEEPDLISAIDRQVHPVCGDITKERLGLSPEEAGRLAEEIGEIIHAAASTSFRDDYDTLRLINTEGTAHLLELARMAMERGGFRRFTHVSTAYVAGTRTGLILESDPLPREFNSPYEKTKAEAEALVVNSGLPYTICRPGMMVGSSETGRAGNFRSVYYLIKLLLQGKLPVAPVSPSQRVNLVPADWATDAVVKLADHPAAENHCFHLTSPIYHTPKVGALTDFICQWAEEELSVKIPKPVFVPAAAPRKKTSRPKNRVLANLAMLSPYLSDIHEFDRANTEHLLGRDYPDWQDYMPRLLRYACRNNFLHRSDRSVFDQILYRLTSKEAPISYFDVSADGIRETKHEEMRDKILLIARSLWALGIRKGRHVAVTGSNCSDYFALDTALGLVGAVTVPIYYTTPADEIDLLLDRSGADILFVGDARIMRQADALKSDVTLVSFAGADGMAIERSCVDWKSFVAKSDQASDFEPALVDPDDLATIRYTSGTTGEPKGVMFNAGQLHWMGQIMTDLVPWKDKQKELRYLSFLPLSHVVEGILASYAPYCMHCPVKYYYLNEFDRLTEALPKVRPTVFFSVPRFYEKLWQQIEENPLGRRYRTMGEGPAKKALGAVLKTAVLKKAGLDCCSQLIVGSAPIAEELLLKFRALGIEIHNAYGQTEAPLITINRCGDNVIPSIGTPLPDTKVTVREDGELVIEGPQVTLGYYGLETDTIRDGVLISGDLGRIDESGHIYLFGRKKEMIITSYGKNINCPKIEERMKNIPGVSEAVLIGENRPYCTALIWLEEGAVDPAGAIEIMNKGLSHPEQIRRFTVIGTPLAISKGELTPNLKVKRAVVADHYREEIGHMYE